MDILLLFFFPISALMRLLSDYIDYHSFFLAICGTESLFILSLVLLKLGKSRISSYLGSLGILVNVLLMACLTPFSGWSDIYKLGVYLIGAIVANALVSLERRQVVVYMAAGIGVYALIVFLVALPRLGGVSGEGITTSLLFLILLVAVNIIVVLMTDLNAKLVDLAEAEVSVNRDRAERLRTLIGAVSGALATGRELKLASEEGRGRSGEIRARLSNLKSEAVKLEEEASSLDDKSAAALGLVTTAKTAVEHQNLVIVDSGADVARMSHTIGELTSMAKANRGEVAEVASLAERQSDEMKELLRGIERLLESSESIINATRGILDVSEKTQLLAMNASIEAAHAGSSGKGFAVIANEIRKLSQEAQESTRRIDEAIKTNEDKIRGQAAAIGRFTESMDKMTGDVRSTFETLGLMIDSLVRIETATNNLSESTGSMLKLAGETKTSVAGVVEGLQSGAASAESTKSFASGFATALSKMLESFAAMDAAIEKAASIGEQNLARMAEIESSLATIEHA
jgi:methyl-accepting chemotaxis protein